MTVEQRIAAINAALNAIEHSIARIEAALRLAMTLADIARLNQELVTLKAQRTRLQFELINLQASQTTIAPIGAAAAAGGGPAPPPAVPKMTSAQNKNAREVAKQLAKSADDRRMIEASLMHSTDVLQQVASLQTLLSGNDLEDDE
jgi:hypothetical protein